MLHPLSKTAIMILSGCFLWGCAHVKEAGRTIGHTTRDVTREIGHGARDVTREIGHGTRDVVNKIGGGTTGSAKTAEEEEAKSVKPKGETSEY